MDLQGPRKKMSKSVASPDGTIWLTDTSDVIQKKIRSAVTDSGTEVKASGKKPAITNLLTIYSICSNRTVEQAEHEFARAGYARFKNALADVLIAYLQPFQDRFREMASAREEIVRVLRMGADKSRDTAAHTLDAVKQRLGWLPQ